MTSKKLKYQEMLLRFPNCPPKDYLELEMDAFRWVHESENDKDFKPRNLINEPPQRMLDDSDIMCKGYGLSLFDSFGNALKVYKKQYKRRRAHQRDGFINEVGKCVATLGISKNDGIAGSFNQNTGHFTFHEYENVDLRTKVAEILNIFDEDGEFINN